MRRPADAKPITRPSALSRLLQRDTFVAVADRSVAFGVVAMLAWILMAALYQRGRGDDWRIFWNAGHYVGASTLITKAHFAYTPGAALALSPLSHLTLAGGYFVYFAVMVAATLVSAAMASKVYGLSFATAALMALAWGPVTIAICLGQNSPVALLLVTMTILGVVRRRETLAGISVGLLLYKPTDAAPMLLLLLILKQWRALGLVALFAVTWYLLSVRATDDWLWPARYLGMLTALYRHDVVANSDFAISIPTILSRLGVPGIVAWISGLAVLLASIPLLLRASRLEAASIVPLLGLAASPHAWGYEAVLVLPAFWLVATRLNPIRGALLAMAYLTAPVYLFARALHFNVLAFSVLGGAACWFLLRLRTAFIRPALAQLDAPPQAP